MKKETKEKINDMIGRINNNKKEILSTIAKTEKKKQNVINQYRDVILRDTHNKINKTLRVFITNGSKEINMKKGIKDLKKIINSLRNNLKEMENLTDEIETLLL